MGTLEFTADCTLCIMKRQYSPLRAKKHLGQHFLHDPLVLSEILSVIHPQRGTHYIEIGPGRGALTEILLPEVDHLIGVEFDADLLPTLRLLQLSFPHFQPVAGDILTYRPPVELTNFQLVGNIPYNLTTKLVERLLSWPIYPDRMVWLLQREVAERMAEKGGKTSPLSLAVQLLGKAEIQFLVPPAAFSPPPKVVSALIVIDGSIRPDLGEVTPSELYDFAHRLYRLPRKTLLNNLIAMGYRSVASGLLSQLGIAPGIRPERLNMQQVLALLRALKSLLPDGDERSGSLMA